MFSRVSERLDNMFTDRSKGTKPATDSTISEPLCSSNDNEESTKEMKHKDKPENDAEETSCLTISMYTAVIIALVCTFLVVGRDYIKYVLMSMEESDLWISFLIFTALFTVVSFPMTWGYILFNIAAGYLYGFMLGLVVVMVCALTGLSLAHFIIKKLLRNFVMRKLANNTLRTIIRVIDSGHGFRVIILSRLTPIPFGLQNAIFAISKITYPRYILASALGMAPSQGMHAYIGSTLRSMEEVMAGGSSHSPTAYLVFIGQLLMVGILLIYVIRRAKNEFNKTVKELDVAKSEESETCVLDMDEKDEAQKNCHVVREYFDDSQRARTNSSDL